MTMHVTDIFKERLTELMKQQGHTKATLADATGLAYVTIQGYMSGCREPRITEAVMVAAALGVSLDYLVGMSNSMHPVVREEEQVFWNRINEIYQAQRQKGIDTYGQSLEQNKAAFRTRCRYLEEELIDALMYIEWIKDGTQK